MEFFSIKPGEYVNAAAIVRVRITGSDDKPVEIELVTGEKVKLDRENGGTLLDKIGKTLPN